MTSALYRTRITHLRRAPVHHYFEHRSYSWFVDVDALPEMPGWLRPFARFDVQDHLWEAPIDTLRGRVDAFLATKGTVSYTHLTLPTMSLVCRSRGSPCH